MVKYHNMKKKIIYIIFTAAISLFASCSSSDDATLRWRKNDISDLKIYAGSSSGAIQVNYDTLKNIDSLRTVLVGKYIGTIYNSDLYSMMSMDFNGNKLTYIDSIGRYKIVSEYYFSHDSLYITKTDLSSIFIAQGTPDELYRRSGFTRYRNSLGRDTVILHNEVLSLESVLDKAIYNNMQDPTDTIVWLNAKYIFR